VTIRTVEAEVPDEFPPARLYLDDIEEILKILVDATDKRTLEWNGPDEELKTIVTFTIKDQICDEVQELPKLAKKTISLSVRVASQDGLPAISLTFSRFRTSLTPFGFTREEQLRIFYKLTPIFNRRNLWFRTLAHSHYILFGALLIISYVVAGTFLTSMLNKQTAQTQAIVTELLPVAIGTILLATGLRHSTVIMRHSSEPSPLRQDLLQKIAVAAISSVLTFLLTLLGFYLKHKYWP